MHKARENANGSFSIGKTWHLDDLSAIESFTGAIAGGREVEEERKWAGGSGFTVTLLKPYFWMAGSPKEKEFFIASLTKIYRKYTGGKLPQLTGFDPKEMEQFLGSQGQAVRAGVPPMGEERSPLAQQRLPVAGAPGSAGQRSLGGESTEDSRTPLSSPEFRRLPSRGSDRDGSSGRGERDVYETPPGGKPGGSEYIPSPRKSDNPPLNGGVAATPEPPEPEPPKSQPTPPIEKSATPPPAPPTGTTAPLKEDEKFRPGLGPMIKKKSNADVASTFRRAATAYNAFKPRAGGAGDTLPDQADGHMGEPDGINGVVPAPTLLRGRAQDLGKSSTMEQPISKKPSDVPDVKVTSPAADLQVVTESPPTIKPQTQAPEKALPKIVKSPPKSPEAQRQPPRSYLTSRHFAAIDVDPSLLEARTVEIEPILSEFGWGGAKVHELKVEVIEAGLKREIGGVEAGSWLDHLEQKDERVEAVERMLDRAIAECDELEGLLALYGVELSVSLTSSHSLGYSHI
jgi:exocyst complex component 1